MADDSGNLSLVEGKLYSVLSAAADREASDVHLTPGYPVMLRVHGVLERGSDKTLDAAECRQFAQEIVPERLRSRLGELKNVDCSVSIAHRGAVARFRANVFLTQGEWAACLRHVPREIPTFEWMGFPEWLGQRLIAHRNGLVIITGITGSGKSTTLAALVNLLNRQGGFRIITVEEPIEYVHPPMGTSVITQREVGRDVDSFLDGLKYGLRQDPDVVLVGEIRDPETARMALSAAETGHLILTTMHTRDAKGAVTRFVDLFPHEAQDDIRAQLSLSLRSVICQHLLPARVEGSKRVLAMEIMHVNQPIRSAIRFGKVDSIESAIQTGKRDGMTTLDDDLDRLVSAGLITLDSARRFAKDVDAVGTSRG